MSQRSKGPHAPWAEQPPAHGSYALVCEEGAVLARKVETATGFFQRGFGWMGRASIDPDEGLYFPRCHAIHSWFMRVAIDLVFVSREGQVEALVEGFAPWRLVSRKAYGTLELPAGGIKKAGLHVGDRLFLDRSLND